MALKTTTWKERNTHNLELTKVFAIEKQFSNPLIIDFGPGGSVDFMAKYLPEGRAVDLDSWKKFVRVFESFLRKTGVFRLVTNEPKEIASIFASLSPSKLLVFDLEKKVINAVNDLVEQSEISIPIEAMVWDILEGPVNAKADIVIALNIVSRIKDKERAMSNIIEAVPIGGLFCINIEESPEGFRKLGHCLFERIS